MDDYTLREAALRYKVAYTPTMSAASAACDAVLALRSRKPSVKSLQEWQRELGVLALSVFIHESSYVDDGARIGDGTKIWHFCT